MSVSFSCFSWRNTIRVASDIRSSCSNGSASFCTPFRHELCLLAAAYPPTTRLLQANQMWTDLVHTKQAGFTLLHSNAPVARLLSYNSGTRLNCCIAQRGICNAPATDRHKRNYSLHCSDHNRCKSMSLCSLGRLHGRPRTQVCSKSFLSQGAWCCSNRLVCFYEHPETSAGCPRLKELWLCPHRGINTDTMPCSLMCILFTTSLFQHYPYRDTLFLLCFICNVPIPCASQYLDKGCLFSQCLACPPTTQTLKGLDHLHWILHRKPQPSSR